MSHPALPALSFDVRLPPEPLRACLLGFLYWLCFLLVLEPGNLLNASAAGTLPSFAHEAIRIGLASMLGAVGTLAPALLTRKLPVSGAAWLRRALVHAAGAGALAFVLILVSCFLAAWVLEHEALPSVDAIRAQLVGNWLLLTYALGALTAILHVTGARKSAAAAAPQARAAPEVPEAAEAPEAPETPAAIEVKSRGRTQMIALADVAWIETQGNYLALHTAAGSHLLRETLTAFEARLDPARFVRIHRRAVVAVERIAALTPATNGDAVLRLIDGLELRVSRSYRDAVKARWQPPA